MTSKATTQPLQSLDRKAMEAERLGRLKRRAGPSIEDTRSKSRRLDIEISPPPMTRRAAAHSSVYSHGAVKRTWAFGFPRRNDIKIEEVLKKHELKTAVLSSYSWDMDWLFSKLLPHTKVELVMQARDENERAALRKDAAGLSTVRLCFPPMPQSPYSTMHSKLMLLFYNDDTLRVVVPSANLVPFDWGETGMMENSVFSIDLPRLQDVPFVETSFSKELMRFVKALGLEKDVQDGILKFDFSSTRDVEFIHTIAGSHTGGNWTETGVAQLCQSVRRLGLQTDSDSPIEIDSTASSIGDLDDKFLQSLSSALRGTSPDRPRSGFNKDELRIHFPSVDTVKDSIGGPQNGGTLFLQPKYWAKNKFPRELFRDYQSTRTGLLSHNKLIFVRTPDKAFFYTGSANLSKAAWGNVTHVGQQPKLYAGNWECGVLLPVARSPIEEDIDTEGEEDFGKTDEARLAPLFNRTTTSRNTKSSTVLPSSVFARIVDIPFIQPAARYGPDAKPWCASMR